MGGMIGMWLGANAPERLHELILCNTGARLELRSLECAHRGRSKKRHEIGLFGGRRSLVYARFPPEVAGNHLKYSQNARRDKPRGLRRLLHAVRDFDFREQLGKIGKPTLVIAGAHDPATPPADGRFLAQHIPGARYAELNAAHLSNIEDQERFNTELAAFLNS